MSENEVKDQDAPESTDEAKDAAPAEPTAEQTGYSAALTEKHPDVPESDSPAAKRAMSAKSLRAAIIADVLLQLERWPERLREMDKAWIAESTDRALALSSDEFRDDDADAIDGYVNERIESGFISMIADHGETDQELNAKNAVRRAIAKHATDAAENIAKQADPGSPLSRIALALVRLNAVAQVTALLLSSGAVSATVEPESAEELVSEVRRFESAALRTSIGGILRCCEPWD